MNYAERISISLDSFFSGEHGCYVYCVPEEFPIKEAVVKAFPELAVVADADLHCTIMCSPEGTPDNDSAFNLLDDTKEFIASAGKLTYWPGHDEAGYLVLQLVSSDLPNRHSQWKSLGCIPTFPSYDPHVTLASKFEVPENFEARIAEFNEYLANYDVAAKKLIFSNEHIEDIKD